MLTLGSLLLGVAISFKVVTANDFAKGYKTQFYVLHMQLLYSCFFKASPTKV